MSHFKKITATLAALGMANIVFAAEQANDAAPAPATDNLTVEGLVTPEREVDLAAPSEGLITEVKISEGDHVTKGQVIAQLSDAEEKILLRNAELQARKLNEDFTSMERLYKEKAASRDDYTKSMLAAQQAASERDLQGIRLEKRSIVSPCDGSILRILKDPGESVQRLEKFAELVSVENLIIIAYVDARYVGRLPVGTQARILPSAGDALTGKVTVSDPVLDPGGTVFRIKVFVKEPSEELQPGTRVQLELPVSSAASP